MVVLIAVCGWQALVACCGGAGGHLLSLVEGGDGRSLLSSLVVGVVCVVCHRVVSVCSNEQ